MIKYVGIETGEAITMVRGLLKTNYGSVTVNLSEHFVTRGEAPLTLLLAPEKAPVLLYAAAIDASGAAVRELRHARRQKTAMRQYRSSGKRILCSSSQF